jgi:hypothetical protein
MLWTLFIFGTPMVLHQYDRTISFFMHIEPAMTLFALNLNKCGGFNAVFYDSFFDMWMSATIVYCIWCCFYFSLNFYFLKDRMAARGYLNTYTYALYSKGVLGTFIKSRGEKMRPLMYFIVHWTSTELLFIFGILSSWFVFQILNVGFVFLSTLWFGALFYFHHFPSTYEKSLGIVPKETEAMAPATNGKKVN